MSCCSKYGNYFKHVTHVIFDLDGTLIDSEKIYDIIVEEIANEFGKHYTEDIKLKITGSTQQQSYEILHNEFQLPITLKELEEKYINLSYKYLTNVDLMPGAEKLVRHLYDKKIPMAIATSSSQDTYDLKTSAHYDFFQLFHHIVCGSSNPDLKKGKPHPEIFLICAQRFPDNPLPEKCLVFEDAPNGIMAALRAGMQVIMLPAPHVPYEIWKNATIRLDSLINAPIELFGLPALPKAAGDGADPTLEEEIHE